MSITASNPIIVSQLLLRNPAKYTAMKPRRIGTRSVIIMNMSVSP